VNRGVPSATLMRHRTNRRVKITAQEGKVLGTAILGACAVIASTGVVAQEAFARPGPAKYAVTVLVPLFLVLFVSSSHSIKSVMATAVFVAPVSAMVPLAGLTLTPGRVLVLFGAVWLYLSSPRSEGRRQWSSLGALLLILLLVLSAVRADRPREALWSVGAELVTFWVAATATRNRAAGPALCKALALAGSLQAVVCVWEFRTGHLVNLYTGTTRLTDEYFFKYLGSFRASGTVEDPVTMGNMLAIAAVMALALFLRAEDPVARAFWGVSTGITCLGLATTFSRMSWLAFAAGVLVVLMLQPAARRFRAFLLLAGLGFAATSLILVVAGASVITRLSSVDDPTNPQVSTAGGDEARLEIWNRAWGVVVHDPFLGIGLGRLPGVLSQSVPGANLGTHAHSTYLNLMAEVGVPAAILLVGVFVLGLVRGGLVLRRVARDGGLPEPWAVGATAGCAVVLICWATDYTLRQPTEGLWVAAVLAMAWSLGSLRAVPDE